MLRNKKVAILLIIIISILSYWTYNKYFSNLKIISIYSYKGKDEFDVSNTVRKDYLAIKKFRNAEISIKKIDEYISKYIDTVKISQNRFLIYCMEYGDVLNENTKPDKWGNPEIILWSDKYLYEYYIYMG